MARTTGWLIGLTLVLAAVPAAPAAADENARAPAAPASLPTYLKDRGTGVATSMFGTYIRRGELIAYPFFEYYRDHDFEYKPSELGSTGEEDFRGRYKASEGLLFLGYGLTEDVAIELEAAVIRASLRKPPEDLSTLPARLEESGLGDVEGQLRWRWRRESEGRPELFSFAGVVFPHHRDKPLIGTPDWELELGTGLTRGFRWGTLTVRASVEYAKASTSQLDLGEYAVEYLKQASPAWRLYVGIEGTQDEVSLVTEAQWRLARGVVLKLNNGLGLTSKATDWAPEVGILFTLPRR